MIEVLILSKRTTSLSDFVRTQIHLEYSKYFPDGVRDMVAKEMERIEKMRAIMEPLDEQRGALEDVRRQLLGAYNLNADKLDRQDMNPMQKEFYMTNWLDGRWDEVVRLYPGKDVKEVYKELEGQRKLLEK